MTCLNTNEVVGPSTTTWNDYWWGAAISDDGRFVAFHSYEVDPSNNTWDILLYDRESKTEVLTIDNGGYDYWWGWGGIDISSDGRYISYYAGAPDPTWELKVHDRTAGTARVVSEGPGPNDGWWAPVC